VSPVLIPVQTISLCIVIAAGAILLIGGSLAFVAWIFFRLFHEFCKKFSSPIPQVTVPPSAPAGWTVHYYPNQDTGARSVASIDPPVAPEERMSVSIADGVVECEDCHSPIKRPSGSTIKDDGTYLTYKCLNCGWRAEYLK